MLRDGRSFGFAPQGEHSFDKASQWLSVNKQKLLEVCYYISVRFLMLSGLRLG